MQINDQKVFVTGANRGIGRAFVSGFLERGARKVYAGVRNPHAIDLALREDPRVQIVQVDITESDQIAAAAGIATDASILVNNAGAVKYGSLLTGPIDDARQLFETNVFGLWEMTRAFAPVLAASQGTMINVLSAISWFSPPQNGAYAATKASAWSLTNGLREELASLGVRVQGLHFGAVNTDFAADYDGPKVPPEQVVRESLNGLEDDASEVLVDDGTRAIKEALTDCPNAYLHQSSD